MSTTPPSLSATPPGTASGAVGGRQVVAAVVGFATVVGLSAMAWQGAAADGGSSWHIGLLGLAVSLPALWLSLLLRRQQRKLDAQARRLAEQDAQLQTLARKVELLHRSEQVAGIGSFDWHPVTGALHWSDGQFRLWGHAPGSLTPDAAAFRARVHPDDLGALEARLQHSLASGGHHEFTHRLRWPDGTVLEVLTCGDVTRDAHGRAVRMMGTVQDITRRRAAEARLQLHEFLVNTITDPVSVVDEAGTCLLVNQAWSQHTGLAAEQVVGRARAALQQQPGSPARDAAQQRCLGGGQAEVVLAELDLPATGRRWWETTLFPFTEPHTGRRGAALVARDVTARQATAQALAASLDNLRLTLNVTGDAIFAADADNPQAPLLFVNDRMLQMWGMPPEQAPALTLAAVMAMVAHQSADPAGQAARIAEIIASSSPQEDSVALRDGRVLLRRCMPTRQAGRAVRVWVWSLRDITAESRAQAGLQAVQAQQRTLLAAFPGHMACIDANLRYTHVNARMAALMGTTPEAVVGRNLADVAGPLRAPQLAHRIARALDGEVQSFEHLHPVGSGQPAVRLLVTLSRGVDSATGQALCHAFGTDITDITDLKRTEAALRAATTPAADTDPARSHAQCLPLAMDGPPGSAGTGDAPEQPPVGNACSATGLATVSTPATGAQAAASGQRQVLYIDDNPVNTLLMAAMFERLPGLVLQCECDPKAGVALALANPPALLLIDIQMPGIDGYEVLRRLRADPATRAVPAIAVSANAMPQDLARGKAAGFADYMTKPLEMQRLQSALQTVLPGWHAAPD
ncbi:MAG: PAS domain S-box protein [Aquabacterium sp.]|nr:PAS domain S-box protein [Aquabacterium sp.]